MQVKETTLTQADANSLTRSSIADGVKEERVSERKKNWMIICSHYKVSFMFRVVNTRLHWWSFNLAQWMRRRQSEILFQPFSSRLVSRSFLFFAFFFSSSSLNLLSCEMQTFTFTQLGSCHRLQIIGTFFIFTCFKLSPCECQCEMYNSNVHERERGQRGCSVAGDEKNARKERIFIHLLPYTRVFTFTFRWSGVCAHIYIHILFLASFFFILLIHLYEADQMPVTEVNPFSLFTLPPPSHSCR